MRNPILAQVKGVLEAVRGSLNLEPFDDVVNDDQPTTPGQGALKETFTFIHQLQGIWYVKETTKTYLITDFDTDEYGLKKPHAAILDRILADYAFVYRPGAATALPPQNELSREQWVFNNQKALTLLTEDQKDLIKLVDQENYNNPRFLGLSKNQTQKITDEEFVTEGMIHYRAISDLLNNNKQIFGVLLIRGAASTPGKTNYNQSLSEKRAQNILTYLTKGGIDASHFFQVDAVGETRPLVPIDENVGVNKYGYIQTRLSERYALTLTPDVVETTAKEALKWLAVFLATHSRSTVESASKDDAKKMIDALRNWFEKYINGERFPYLDGQTFVQSPANQRYSRWNDIMKNMVVSFRAWYLIARTLNRFLLDDKGRHQYAMAYFDMDALFDFRQDKTDMFREMVRNSLEEAKQTTAYNQGYSLAIANAQLYQDPPIKTVMDNHVQYSQAWVDQLKALKRSELMNRTGRQSTSVPGTLWLTNSLIWKDKFDGYHRTPRILLKHLTSDYLHLSKYYIKYGGNQVIELFSAVAARMIIQANWSPFFRYSHFLEFNDSADAIDTFEVYFENLDKRAIKRLIEDLGLKMVGVRLKEFKEYDAMVNKHASLKPYWE